MSVGKRKPTLDMSGLSCPELPREEDDPVVVRNEGPRRAWVHLAY